MIFKSKQVLTATLIIALGAALAVNWYYKEAPNQADDKTTSIEEVSGNLGDTLYVGATTYKSEESTDTTSEKADDSTSKEEYFAQAKLKRKQSHDTVIETVEKTAQTDNLDTDTKNRLVMMISDFQSQLKTETDCENLISAKTSKDCLVVINDDACQVIMEENTLNDLLILQITEIIEKNTEISSENLTIIELK